MKTYTPYFKSATLLVVLSMCTSLFCISQTVDHFKEIKKLVASDSAQGDLFGSAVSISGNYAIIGAFNEDEDAAGMNTLDDPGSAYIFERDSAGIWYEVQKLVASDRADEDFFGQSVSISGNYAIVGARLEDEDSAGNNTIFTAGSAYIFERDISGMWSETQKIVASDRAMNDRFGWSLSMSGGFAVVGAPTKNLSSGSVYIFQREPSGDWNEITKIIGSDVSGNDLFGFSVSISENYILVGAPGEDEDASEMNTLESAGSVYIFERDSLGNWLQKQKIVASDRHSGDVFGRSVSISGKFAVIGAEFEDDDTAGINTLNEAGSAYIFERDTNGNWTETQKIVASDRNTGDKFGMSVSISEKLVIIGTSEADGDSTGMIPNFPRTGAAYIFEKDSSGVWSEIQKIVAKDQIGSSAFGKSVDISGEVALVGDWRKTLYAPNSGYSEAGAAYIFENNPIALCPRPANSITEMIGYSTSRLTWDSVPSAIGYIIQGRPLGSGATVSLSVSNGSTEFFDVANLNQGTSYEWRIQSVCNSDGLASFQTELDTFTTLRCNFPDTITESLLNPTSVLLSWSTNSNAVGYLISGGRNGFSPVNIFINNPLQNSLTVNNLDPGVSYVWLMKTVCDQSPYAESKFSSIRIFTMPLSNSPKSDLEMMLSKSDVFNAETTYHIYPNPNDGFFILDLVNMQTPGKFFIYDQLGKELIERDVPLVRNQKVDINMDGFDSGTYLVKWVGEGKQILKKVVIY